MARIRSIKPEFWIDEKVVELSAFARLLFIGMWNFTDDQGYIEYKPKRLKMQIFPADSIDVESLVAELLGQGVVKAYDSPIGPVLHIVNWVRHQRVDKPGKARFDQAELSPYRPPPSPPQPAGTPPGGLPEAASSDPWSVAVPTQPHATNSDLQQPADHPEFAELGVRGSLPEPSPSPRESSPAEWRGREGKGEEGKGQELSVLAVGELTSVTRETPRTPTANRKPSSRSSVQARAIIAAIPRYRRAEPWVRARLATLADHALTAGHGAGAIQRAAEQVIAEGRYLDYQHIPELRAALTRLARDLALGDACETCGLPECDCRAPVVEASADEIDSAVLADLYARLGVDPADLAEGIAA